MQSVQGSLARVEERVAVGDCFAADHDYLRIDDVHQTGEVPAQSFTRFTHDRMSGLVSRGDGGDHFGSSVRLRSAAAFVPGLSIAGSEK